MVESEFVSKGDKWREQYFINLVIFLSLFSIQSVSGGGDPGFREDSAKWE